MYQTNMMPLKKLGPGKYHSFVSLSNAVQTIAILQIATKNSRGTVQRLVVSRYWPLNRVVQRIFGMTSERDCNAFILQIHILSNAVQPIVILQIATEKSREIVQHLAKSRYWPLNREIQRISARYGFRKRSVTHLFYTFIL